MIINLLSKTQVFDDEGNLVINVTNKDTWKFKKMQSKYFLLWSLLIISPSILSFSFMYHSRPTWLEAKKNIQEDPYFSGLWHFLKQPNTSLPFFQLSCLLPPPSPFPFHNPLSSSSFLDLIYAGPMSPILQTSLASPPYWYWPHLSSLDLNHSFPLSGQCNGHTLRSPSFFQLDKHLGVGGVCLSSPTPSPSLMFLFSAQQTSWGWWCLQWWLGLQLPSVGRMENPS